MIVQIMEQILKTKNEIEAVEKLIGQVNEMISSSNYVINYINIDGINVYNDYYSYIVENLEQIKQIKVEVITVKELADDSILSVSEYLTRMLPEVKKLADEFYQGVGKELWDKFQQMLEGLQWLDTMISTIDQNTIISYEKWDECVVSMMHIQNELRNLKEAIGAQDIILIGDILNYEIVRILQVLDSQVKRLIDNEVVPNALN